MEKNTDLIKHDSGYGLIKRNIMRNKNISLQAKAVYSYLISFAGNSMQAFPTQKLMCEELGISDKSLKKYINELKDKDLIIVEQKRTKTGVFTRNIYTLTDQAVGNNVPEGKTYRTEEVSATVGNNFPSPEGKIYPPNNNNVNNNNINNNNKGAGEKKDPDVEAFTNNEELKKLIYEFIKSRKKLKKPFTEVALKRMLSRLKKMARSESEQMEIIENSIINGWAGIFPIDKSRRKESTRDYFDEVDSWANGGIDYGQAALRSID